MLYSTLLPNGDELNKLLITLKVGVDNAAPRHNKNITTCTALSAHAVSFPL